MILAIDINDERYYNKLNFTITYIQGRHQGLTAQTESGGPGLMGARRGARDLGKKARRQ